MESSSQPNTATKVRNAFSNALKYVSEMKVEIGITILIILTLTIIIIALIYYYYKKNLMSTEISKMDSLYGKINGSLKSINPSDPSCGYTLKDYYIKTAYNCCAGGSYDNGYVNTSILRSVLKDGCRGLDFEIYSVNDQPVVSTSSSTNFNIKGTYNNINFDDVLKTIINYAFSPTGAPNTNDPVVLHLRIKSNNSKMFQNFANILKKYDNYFLGPSSSYENGKTNIGNLKLIDLSKKILIIAEKNNSSFMDNRDFYEYINMLSNSVYMRALTAYEIKNTPDLAELQNFNKTGMTISMPDKGSNPANPSAVIARESGCQMISMRYQKQDINLKESTKFFNDNGYAFVLKPSRLRYVPTVIAPPNPQNPAVSYETRTVSSDFYSYNV